MDIDLGNLVYIDFEYKDSTITEAGIISGDLELSFKITDTKDTTVNYNKNGDLTISPTILAQNLYIICRGKTIVHYGGRESRLVNQLLYKINNYIDKQEFNFMDLQHFLRKITGVPELPTLVELSKVLGVTDFTPHLALEDARATKACLHKICNNSNYYTPLLREYMYNRTKEAILKPTLYRLDQLNKSFPEYDSVKIYETELKPIEPYTVFSR